MSKKTRSTTTVMPTSIDEVELKGEGGLKRAFLSRTVLTIIVMGIVFMIASLVIYSRALQKEMRGDLKHVSHMVLTYYEDMYPGDYNLLIDEANSATYLKKGDELISDDIDFVSDIAEKTNTEITLFFYDTRMITTIAGDDGKPAVNTIVNSTISQSVLVKGEEAFFNDLDIAKERYCAQYTPIFASSGTCVGMIGVARTYNETMGYVYKLSFVYGAIVLIAGILAALWMTNYTSLLVKHLDKLRDFLGSMAGGHLDEELDQAVLDREDEVGDMGRCALFVRGSLKKLVEKDPLTNLNNRRSGHAKIDQIRKAAGKYGQVYSIAMGDIDYFKKVNDTYGHDAGDAVLKEVARILSDKLAGHGTVIRWGGEEFLFILEEMKVDEARDFLWDILYAVRETSVEYGGQTIKFTMSYGVVEGNPGRSADAEITEADELLYYAKEHGRNRVCSEKSEELMEPGAPMSALDLLDKQNAEDNGTAKSVLPAKEDRPVTAMELLQKKKNEAQGKDAEMWDIYDVDKNLTGRTMKRNDFTMKPGDYHLTVLGAVVNRSGQFLITRRVMSKSWAPGWWEISGGAAMAGETSAQAVAREIREETGLDVTGADGGYMFTYRRDNPEEGDNYFVDVYRFVMDFTDDDIRIQKEEADGYMLATAQDIKELGADEVFLHYNSIKEVFDF
ncbi:MAG: diguanylate cyclase [Lachnospiraceae bacterium]|nr:diguanylate cyclase [Lachnospiraceae bacterium]